MRKKQLELNLYQGRHGGRRPGAGRKRLHSKGVSHRTRETVTHRNPLHINFKYKVQIRNKTCLKILKRAVINARKHGLGVIHFSLQSNHVHLIVEATDNETLTRGMRSLTVTFVKRLKRGKIQLSRYHLHVLKTIQESKNAINYVLFNQQSHEVQRFSKIDGYCSLLAFREALPLIRDFARKKKMTLAIGKRGNYDELSPGMSFLYKRSWNVLTARVALT